MNLKNPNLWSALGVVVAIVALILTQLPPIGQMMRGTDIRITTPDEISISHNLGNISLGVFLDVYNAGGHIVNISKIECIILETDTNKVFTLPVKTYRIESSGSLLLLGTITLNPDQHWSNEVISYNSFTRSELEQVNDLRTRIHLNIVEKIEKQQKLSGYNMPQSDWVEIDDKLYQEAVNFFSNKFELTREGNYQLFIKAISDSGETLRVQGLNFTLFKNNIQELRRITEKDYKYGAGIVRSPRYVPEVIYIPVTRMSEDEAKLIYQQKVANR